MACRQLLAETELAKARLAEALEMQAEQHRGDLVQVLNQSDGRLQVHIFQFLAQLFAIIYLK